MSLEDTCLSYYEKLLYFQTFYGWGWTRKLAGQDGVAWQTDHSREAAPVSDPFHARLKELHFFEGRILTGLARVEETTSPHHGEWVAFCVRTGFGTDDSDIVANFPTQVLSYNLGIGVSKPSIAADRAVPIPYWITFQNDAWVHGFGRIAESKTAVEAWERNRQYSRWRKTDSGEMVYETTLAMPGMLKPEWRQTDPPDGA
jgi:hypothetical protein